MSDSIANLQNIQPLKTPKIPREIIQAARRDDLASVVAFFQGAVEYRKATYIDYNARPQNRKFNLYHYLGAVYAAQSLDKGMDHIKSMIKRRTENEWDPSTREQEESGTSVQAISLGNHEVSYRDYVPITQEEIADFRRLKVQAKINELEELFAIVMKQNQAVPIMNPSATLDRTITTLRRATETGEIRNILPAMVSGYISAFSKGQEYRQSDDQRDLKTFQASDEEYRQHFASGFNIGKVIQEQINPQEIATWYRDFGQFVQKARVDLAEQINDQLAQELPERYQHEGVISVNTMVKLNVDSPPSRPLVTDHFKDEQHGSIIIQKEGTRYGPPGQQWVDFNKRPKVYVQLEADSPYYQMDVLEFSFKRDPQNILLATNDDPDRLGGELVITIEGDQCTFGSARRSRKSDPLPKINRVEGFPEEIEVQPYEKWVEKQQAIAAQNSTLQLNSELMVRRSVKEDEVLGKPRYSMGQAADGMEILVEQLETFNGRVKTGVFIRQGSEGPFSQCLIDPQDPKRISTPYFEESFSLDTEGGITLTTLTNSTKEFGRVPKADFPNQVTVLAWDLHRNPDATAPESTKQAYQQCLMGIAIAYDVGALTVAELEQLNDYLSVSSPREVNGYQETEIDIEAPTSYEVETSKVANESSIVERIVRDRIFDRGAHPTTQLQPDAVAYLRTGSLLTTLESAKEKRAPNLKERFLDDLKVIDGGASIVADIRSETANREKLDTLPLVQLNKTINQSIKRYLNPHCSDGPSAVLEVDRARQI